MSAIASQITAEEQADYDAWREKVKGTNISDKSLLATDYLNHFNEIVMMIEMVGMMPDMIEDCKEWQPVSYLEHFRRTNFAEKEMVEAAYGHIPAVLRQRFESTIEQLDRLVLGSIAELDRVCAAGDADLIMMKAENAVKALHTLSGVANGLIHGSDRVMAQDEIDTLIEDI